MCTAAQRELPPACAAAGHPRGLPCGSGLVPRRQGSGYGGIVQPAALPRSKRRRFPPASTAGASLRAAAPASSWAMRGLLLRWRGRSYLWLRNPRTPPTRSRFRPVRVMAVLLVETSRVSDLRLPLPTLLGHGDQAPLLERAGGKRELGAVRRDGVGSVPDAGEECELPVVYRRPSVHVDRRTVCGLLGTSCTGVFILGPTSSRGTDTSATGAPSISV